jgi:hypothetical protein
MIINYKQTKVKQSKVMLLSDTESKNITIISFIRLAVQNWHIEYQHIYKNFFLIYFKPYMNLPHFS